MIINCHSETSLCFFFFCIALSLSLFPSLFLSLCLSFSLLYLRRFDRFLFFFLFFFLFVYLFIFIYYNFIKRDYVRSFLSSFSFRFRFRFDLIVTFPWFLFALFVRFFLVILVSSVSVGEGSNLFFDQISLPITGLKLVFFQIYFSLSKYQEFLYIHTYILLQIF